MPRRRGVRSVSLSCSAFQRHDLRIIAGLEGWKRAAALLVIERLKGPLCRITEARPSPEAASGTLCLVEC